MNAHQCVHNIVTGSFYCSQLLGITILMSSVVIIRSLISDEKLKFLDEFFFLLNFKTDLTETVQPNFLLRRGISVVK